MNTEQELKQAKDLLLEAMSLLEYDQWPEPKQCQELSELRSRIVKYLGVKDEWAESWKRMYDAQAEHYRKNGREL